MIHVASFKKIDVFSFNKKSLINKSPYGSKHFLRRYDWIHREWCVVNDRIILHLFGWCRVGSR